MNSNVCASSSLYAVALRKDAERMIVEIDELERCCFHGRIVHKCVGGALQGLIVPLISP